MRLLAITNCFPRSFKDTRAPWNRQQFLALAKLHHIRLVVPVPFTQRRASGEKNQLTWSDADDFQADYPGFWFTPRCMQQHYGTFMLKSIRPTVDRVLESFSPDAVLGCWAHPDGYAAVEIARSLRVPALVKVVGSDVLVLGRSKRRRERIADALRRADGVLAVSQHLAGKVIELGVEPAKVHVVPEGIDTTLFFPAQQAAARIKLQLPEHGRMLLFVGNLLLSKGAGVLLQACRAMMDRKIDFTCYLVGSGKDETQLRQLASGLNLGRHVVFAGARQHHDLPDWYRAADVVTLPSFSEGIPNTLREALCCGKPFVATRVGGIPEISPPAMTRLVEPGNVDELVTALTQMLENLPVVDEETARTCCISWEQSAGMIDALLQKLVRPPAPPTSRMDFGNSSFNLRPLRDPSLEEEFASLLHHQD